MAYGPAWAQVSATPFKYYKGALAEGGIRSPLIVRLPGTSQSANINTSAIMHVMDVAPTLLELAGASIPEVLQGRSWAPMLRGGTDRVRDETDVLAMEFQSARMVRIGKWKGLWMPKPYGTDSWQIYDLDADPGETLDLASEHPAVTRRLAAAWDVYARQNNVVLPDRTFYDGLDQLLPPRPPVQGKWPQGQEPNWSNPNP